MQAMLPFSLLLPALITSLLLTGLLLTGCGRKSDLLAPSAESQYPRIYPPVTDTPVTSTQPTTDIPVSK